MKYTVFLFIIIIATSCNYFETEKITSETFYTEEIKTIDFKDVDTFPVFKSCENSTEKEASKQCFISALSDTVTGALLDRNLVAMQDLDETIAVSFQVSAKGIIAIQHIEIDSLAALEFPKLKEWISQRLDSMTLIAPAYKRGIPVTTEFTLPINLSTGNN
ncbi:hypothetical protein ULMS_00300 [Patiriisocius marinistellae]|uniref:Uncharacterized protein n=1 Tax=Patiriisocius marinistellae TaxID=2494560 RepID=A0A5J4FU93_9FLAO|nr:hypothetical protein [Patiriisocius marinistellae]GEQ84522.1 hypothetical protein ULMS_00300 [Patiriisocius marinistellae]